MVMRKFEPNEEQREAVAILSSTGRVGLEEIAKFIVNPRTNRPISVKTLNKLFKLELAENTELKRLLVERFTAAVKEGAAWAIKFGMEYIVGFDSGGGKPGVVINNNQLNAEKLGIRVEFVPPNPRQDGNDGPPADYYRPPRQLPHLRVISPSEEPPQPAISSPEPPLQPAAEQALDRPGTKTDPAVHAAEREILDRV
jgi:hypothetical protein